MFTFNKIYYLKIIITVIIIYDQNSQNGEKSAGNCRKENKG